MLTSEPNVKENTANNKKTSNVLSTSHRKISEVFQGLAFTIERPLDCQSNHFAAQLIFHLTHLMEKIGLQPTIKTSPIRSDHLFIRLDGNGYSATSTLDLVDSEGNYFSEVTLQASSGILSIHGRNREQLEPMAVEYATTFIAVNFLTGLLAQFYAELNHTSPTTRANNSHYSALAATLLGASQYIADATAEAPFPLPEGCRDSSTQPPFKTADGIHFELESLDAEIWRRFWQQLNIEPKLIGKGWQAFQMRYAKAVSPLPMAMVVMLQNLTFNQIERLCQSAGMAIIKITPLSQHAKRKHCRQLWENGPWHFSQWTRHQNPLKIHQPPHTNNERSNLPLANVNVVESCRRIQGPLATHILGVLGAKVTRIEPPGGDPLRGMPPVAGQCSVRFDAINCLKSIEEINIKTAQGKENIFALTNKADVFIHNWAPHKAKQLGLEQHDLAASNPRLIYSYASGWANSTTTNEDYYTEYPGTDFVVQAVSGVASTLATNQQFSASKEGSLFTILDTLGGAIAAQGIVIGLIAKTLVNQGCYVETSLLGAANVLTSAQLKQIYLGHYQPKSDGLNGIFTTQTRPIAVHLPELDCHRELAEKLNIEVSAEFSPRLNSERINCIKQAFTSRTASEWLKIFAALKIPASVVIEDLSEIRTHSVLQPWLEKSDYEKINSPWSFL